MRDQVHGGDITIVWIETNTQNLCDLILVKEYNVFHENQNSFKDAS